jgi:hypothetical protein
VLLGVAVRALSTMVDDPESQIRVEQFGDQLLEYAVLLIMIMDASFSIIITAIFLRPIAEVLRNGSGKNKSPGFRDLENIMYMTLAGSTIAVLSSSILYVNLLMFFNGAYTIFMDNAFLNPLVFMGNIDSILNSVGMLLVSGILKNLSPLKIARALTSSGFLKNKVGDPSVANNSSVFAKSSAYAVGSLVGDSVVDVNVNDKTGSIRRLSLTSRLNLKGAANLKVCLDNLIFFSCLGVEISPVIYQIGNKVHMEPEHEHVWEVFRQHRGLLQESFENMDLAFVPRDQEGLRGVTLGDFAFESDVVIVATVDRQSYIR